MPIKRLISVVAMAMGCAVTFGEQAPASLTTIHAIRSLSNAEAARNLPVAFEATVTYFRSYESTLFVEDKGEAIYVRGTTSIALEPGDRILLRGTTYADFRPDVVSNNITLLGHGAAPRPVHPTYGEMIRGRVDCMYVALRGVVRSTDMQLSAGHPVTQLELAVEGGYVGVTMDNADPEPLKRWLDAEVEITGVEAGRFDGKMQQAGVLLHTTSFANVRVLRPAAHDPWSIPVTPMDKVLETYNVVDHTGRVRVEGVITYYHQAQMAVLQNGSRSIRVLTPQLDPLAVGSRAEAIGIPFVDNGFLTLKLGAIRALGPAAPVTPAQVTWNELAASKHAFDLVSIEGTLVSQVREQAQDVYIISSNRQLFSATVRHPFVYEWPTVKQPPPMPVIAPGSLVRLTGVSILDDGNPFNGAMSFGVLMRTAGDVTVIARPSWLNVRNLMKIVTLLLAAIVVVGAWGWMLQRKVHRQTRAIASRIESEAIVERRRSRILEDINNGEPIAAILAGITDLVSFQLGDAPCCCELADGTHVGGCGVDPQHRAGVRHEIPSRSGPPHGFIFAGIDPGSASAESASAGLTMGASLAALTIESSRLYSDLVYRSEFDLLTDVRNRFSFEKELDALVAEAREQRHAFGLIFVDLDYFKRVNDRYGHQAGDQYLQAAAARMKGQLRSCDTLARLGGDEFAALVRDVSSRAGIEEIAMRMEHCFDDPFTVAGNTVKGSASLGIALYPEDGYTRDSLLNTADAAMYVAKQMRSERICNASETARRG
jgi:diguanylate cyclase (GGDEF)-like protein